MLNGEKMTENSRSLKRSLTHGQMTMIVLGSALGTGLFLGSGEAIDLAGPAVILSYALGSLLAAIIGGATGEMAVHSPVRGGFGSIATKYLGSFAGFLTRWAYWTCTTVIAGIELVAVASYLRFWWPQLPLWAGIAIFAALIIGLNIRRVKYFGCTELILSSVKVIALIVFIVVGLCLIFFGLPGQDPVGTAHLSSDGGFMPGGIKSVWLSLAVVMFSFGGIEMISISAAEAQDPARSVRTSAKAMMWRLASFYVLAMFVVMCLLPWRQAAQLGEQVEASPFVMVFADLGIPAAASVTNLVVLTAALSAANANLYAATRLLHSLAADAMAPVKLAKVSGQGIPVSAMWASSLGVLLAIILAVVQPGSAFSTMMTLVMVCALTVWVLILLAYMAFKRVEGNSSAFRIWGGRASAALGILMLLAIWAALFMAQGNAAPAAIGLVYFMVLTMIYFAVVRKVYLPDEAIFEEARQASEGSDS